MSPSDFHEASREVKLMVIEELVAAMEDDHDKIVKWEIEGVHPTFYVLRFSLSGEAQANIDRVAVERGLWGMGPAPKESS